MLDETIEKIVNIEKELSELNGEFVFFGLLKRTDLLDDQWDIVMSAEWIKDEEKVLITVLDKIKKAFGDLQISFLANVVPLDPGEEFVRLVTKFVSVQHAKVELRDSEVPGLRLRHAIIITSNPRH